MKKVFKIIKNTLLALVILFGLLVVVSMLPMTGNIKLLTVLSGSMEPKIHIGSLIFIKPASEYNIGDVVTRQTDEENVTITHRIIEKKEVEGQTIFRTKGDANNAEDNVDVSQDKILGKVFLNIPYLGYPVGYAKTKEGLIIIVVIPATIIIYEEILKIKNEAVKIWKEKKEKKDSEQDDEEK